MGVDYDLDQIEYQALAEFRYQLRRFLHFSEEKARVAGLETQQYQLLLAIKGLPADKIASVGELAERLQLQHHSTVELISRMVGRGLIKRRRDESDQRRVLISLTAHGDELLKKLAFLHSVELRTTGPALVQVLNALIESQNKARGGSQ